MQVVLVRLLAQRSPEEYWACSQLEENMRLGEGMRLGSSLLAYCFLLA